MTDDRKPTWLDDPDAPASEEEKIASARLRDALADPRIANVDAELARALSLANEPRELAEAENRQIAARVLEAAKPQARRGVVVRVTFGVAAAVALAAGAMLVVGQLQTEPAHESSVAMAPVSPAQAPALVHTHSTQALFDEPFAKPLSRGAASARIDRIAMARAGDLRENRFAMWGVR
jgi:cytochrome c-type biogenesis protein CcmH/NrfG